MERERTHRVGARHRSDAPDAIPNGHQVRVIKQIYDRILDGVQGRYGNQVTSDQELREMMNHYKLTPGEVGSKGDFESMVDNKENVLYGIYNTDHHPPGTHWFCVYDGYVYDPLGDDQSKTPEQPKEDDDCGQRCIAYLIMCKKLGKGAILM